MRPAPALRACVLLALAACSTSSFSTELRGEATLRGGEQMGGVLGFPAVGSFTHVDFDEDVEFRNQGVTKDEVSAARVSSVRVRLLSPVGQDFGFLDTVRCFAQAGDREVLVAERSDIASLDLRPSDVLSLQVRDEELQPFVSAPAMSFILRGSGRIPPQDVRLEAIVRLDVTVKML